VGIALGGDRLTPLMAVGAVLMVAGTYWGQAVERAHRTAGAAPSPTRGARNCATSHSEPAAANEPYVPS
jgi:hypothetical protein